ncbi:MAG: acetolactate synthase small subunit [Rikenellaceae bacterium]
MEKREYIVTAFTENQVGVLNRLTAIYLRRKINIESLRVAESSIKGISMFVITAITTEDTILTVVRHIKKIIEVLDVKYYKPEELITQEVALYKISKEIFSLENSADIVARNKNVRIIELAADYIVVELTGAKDKIIAYREKLEEMGVLEQFTSSGSVVLHRENINFLNL